MNVTLTIAAGSDFERKAVLEIGPEDSPEKVQLALAEACDLLANCFCQQFPQYKTPRDIAMALLVSPVV